MPLASLHRAQSSPRRRSPLRTWPVFPIPIPPLELTTRAIDLACGAAAPLVQSAALDRLSSYHLAHADLAEALDAVRRRGDVLATVPLDASSGFQFNVYLLRASEIHLAAGNLALAAHHADTLAELTCYREQGYPAIARRIKVDAIAGDLERAVTGGERFLIAWERAGRPRATTLNTATYVMTMVHGLLGDERRRRQWVDVTTTLMSAPKLLTSCVTGWAPTFDALVALDRDQPDLALARLSADVDAPGVWSNWAAAMWRPWYAALWAEAAVLGQHPDTQSRLHRSIAATIENPIASAMLQRAADLANGDHHALRTRARTFAELGCRYQQRRTETLLNSAPPPDSAPLRPCGPEGVTPLGERARPGPSRVSSRSRSW